MYHVSSSSNRASILANGLDSGLMEAARGIAGSRSPEQQGCFPCLSEDEVAFFVRMNNTGGTIDVWAVGGVEEEALVEWHNGYHYLPGRVSSSQVVLLQADVEGGRPA